MANLKSYLQVFPIHFSQVFQPYAKFWLPCLIDLILEWRHNVEGLQYFVVDVIVTMLSWGSTATPDVCMYACAFAFSRAFILLVFVVVVFILLTTALIFSSAYLRM